MLVVNTHQAKSQLSALIEKALAGENVVIARAGKPTVKLSVYTSPKKPRVPGKLMGKIWVAPDFDDESGEINDLFYKGHIEP